MVFKNNEETINKMLKCKGLIITGMKVINNGVKTTVVTLKNDNRVLKNQKKTKPMIIDETYSDSETDHGTKENMTKNIRMTKGIIRRDPAGIIGQEL